MVLSSCAVDPYGYILLYKKEKGELIQDWIQKPLMLYNLQAQQKFLRI